MLLFCFCFVAVVVKVVVVVNAVIVKFCSCFVDSCCLFYNHVCFVVIFFIIVLFVCVVYFLCIVDAFTVVLWLAMLLYYGCCYFAMNYFVSLLLIC